jgi:hypothetical protein
MRTKTGRFSIVGMGNRLRTLCLAVPPILVRLKPYAQIAKSQYGSGEITGNNAPCYTVRPFDLSPVQLFKDLPTVRGGANEFSTPVQRIGQAFDDALGDQDIDQALNALALQSHESRDLRHRRTFLLDRAKHLPASAGKTEIGRHAVSRREQPAVETEHFEQQFRKNFCRTRLPYPVHLLSVHGAGKHTTMVTTPHHIGS